MEAAMRLMQSGGHMRKIFLLDENSTYPVASNIASLGVPLLLNEVPRTLSLSLAVLKSHSAVLTSIQSDANKRFQAYCP
ncbi:unnamed protein product [Clonostachys byssicola]|uniref:Uncharacterized protein n=1 Tax=Clonostachys byssicola TaxID=160290 RepID=A0A9N9Y0J2_9HYPO|nr:unnamed protein product [Clonostachys byssicola]